MAEIEDNGLLSNPTRGTTSPREAAEQRWGTMVASRYRVEELLSFDDMGALYRARDTERGAACALRILPEIYASSPEIRDRFLRDAEAAQVLRHENIVEVFDTGKLEDGGVYSVMELLDGQDLRSVVHDEGKISPGRAVHIMSQVCRALGTAHEMGIVHRDLKPSNIVLVTQDGELDFVKVLDFGICSHIDSETSAKTDVDKLVGSPDYMAPEQAAGAEAKPESDIYALGTVLYEILTGKLPYSGRNAIDLLMKKGREPAPRVDELVREIPEALADLVAQCIAPRVEERVGSMRILEVELLKSLDDKPAYTKIPPPPEMGERSPQASMSAGRLAPEAARSSPGLPASASMTAPRSHAEPTGQAAPPAVTPPAVPPPPPPQPEPQVVVSQTREGSSAWLWLVGAGTVAVVMVLFGPTIFGGAPPPPEPAPAKKTVEEPETKEVSETKLEEVQKDLAKPKPIAEAPDPLVIAGKADLALSEGRFCEPPGESVRDYLAALRELDPKHEAIERIGKKMPDAALATGKKVLGEGRFADAGQIFRCVLALAPETQGVAQPLSEALVGEGKIMRAMKAWDDLVPLLEELDKLGVKPTFEALVLRGHTMVAKARWAEAVTAFTAALKIRKTDKDVKKALDAAKKEAKKAAKAEGKK